MKQTFGIAQVLLLLLAFVVYSCESVFVKLASNFQIFSIEYLLFFGLAIAVLGIYAVLWQIVLKQMPLSLAFNSKSITVVIILLFARFLFGEEITIKNMVGSSLIIGGIILMPHKI
jgi:multidrug transporter EmrE-like cation transporter